uniref:Reverse transcriptase domain-containing protein n=1 Tax=Amphimedon queenslandica TaxID=400682 RepID=A0A1X7TVH7_AMPQE
MGSGGTDVIRPEPLTGGNAKAAIQGSDSRTSSSGSRQMVLLEPLPSPQKGRRNETSDKPKESQQVCSPSPLQDGGTTHTQRPAQKERLDDQAGSDGRLLHDPHPKFQQTSATLSIQNRIYQFSCLPFGLSCAPWVFTKTLKPALTVLRELGVRLVAYIDDILVLAETEEMARDHTEGFTYLLENLGFIIHPE